MAEPSSSFPQIPASVWWGVRDILKKTTRNTLNDSFLAIQLGVQSAAARQYASELKRVGLTNDEGKPTELALRWRLEDEYTDAVKEILRACYDEELLSLAPTAEDKDKAVSWFQYQGLGEGASRNKAATYFLIGSPVPGQAAPKANGPSAAPKKKKSAVAVSKSPTSVSGTQKEHESRHNGNVFPINLNLQIHISSEATADQIDAIFSSMKKHLGNAPIS